MNTSKTCGCTDERKCLQHEIQDPQFITSPQQVDPPKVNTSKSLDQILEELQQPSKKSYPGERLKRRKEAATAIVEAVEGLIGEDEMTEELAASLGRKGKTNDFHRISGKDWLRRELRQAIKEWQ